MTGVAVVSICMGLIWLHQDPKRLILMAYRSVQQTRRDRTRAQAPRKVLFLLPCRFSW